MNADTENAIKHCSACLYYQKMQPKEKTIPLKVLVKPWEVVGTDIFMVNNKNVLCIVDYYSKFLVMKKVESMSPEDLIKAIKVIFGKFGLPKNLV